MSERTRNERSQQTPHFPREIEAAVRRRGLEKYLLEEPLVIAVSGGADSLALLFALCDLRGERAASTLHVAHINHGFRGEEGDADARFVVDTARSLGLNATVVAYDVPAYAIRCGLSPEDAARKVRYHFLAGICAEHGLAVAVAHTADDQAETVLLHLLRGSGTGGLVGMRMLSIVPVERTLDACPDDPEARAELTLFRPLLLTTRQQVEEYCTEKGLHPRVDSTNSDTAYKRNLVRHEILPLLERASPAVKRRLVQLADVAGEDDRLLNSLAKQEFDRVTRILESGRIVEILPKSFGMLPMALQRRVVRAAIERLAGSLEDFEMEHVDAVAGVISASQGSPTSCDLPRHLRVVRLGERGFLYDRRANVDFSELEAPGKWPLLKTGEVQPLQTGQPLQLSSGWSAYAVVEGDAGAALRGSDHTALFDFDALQGAGMVLRTRKPGDFMRPLGLGGRKSLQDLFVDAKIPALLRDRVAILATTEQEDEALWVPGPGGRRSELAPVTEKTRRILRIQFTQGVTTE